MRHGKKFNHLSRTSTHRKSMLANMATSLILHKRITTTLAKAKALRQYVEPLITRSKEDTTHSRRIVFSYLESKEAVTELFREVSTKVAERPGGYTRILKLGQRAGDSAEMAIIELVDFNLNLLETKTAGKAKSTRRGRRGSAKKTETETPVAAAGTKAKAKKSEEPVAAPVVEEIKEETTEAAVEPEADIAVETPETPAEEPEAIAEEAETVVEEPETVAEEPEAAAEQPEVKAEETETVVEEPEAAAEQPEAKAEEPETVVEEPEAAAEKPETVAEEETGKEEPPAEPEDGTEKEKKA